MRARPIVLLLGGPVALGALAALGSLALPGCGGNASGGGSVSLAAAPDSPQVFGEVGEFALVDSRGQPVTRASLLGRAWILSTFFTTCSQECPMLMSGMREVRAELQDSDVRLASITVDPTLDTPEKLAEYAAALEADPERWLLLTGDEPAIYALLVSSFFLPVGPRAPMGVEPTHDRRLVVLDPRGGVRGYYDGTTSEGRAAAVARARAVAAEPAR